MPFENNHCFHCCLSLSFTLHFYLNFVGSKLQSIQYRVFSWPPDWGNPSTTTTIMATPPPSCDQPHSTPRAIAAARHCLTYTNPQPGRQDSTRHAIKHCSSVSKPSRPTPYSKAHQPQPQPARRTAESRFHPNSSTQSYKTPAATRRRSPNAAPGTRPA